MLNFISFYFVWYIYSKIYSPKKISTPSIVFWEKQFLNLFSYHSQQKFQISSNLEIIYLIFQILMI